MCSAGTVRNNTPRCGWKARADVLHAVSFATWSLHALLCLIPPSAQKEIESSLFNLLPLLAALVSAYDVLAWYCIDSSTTSDTYR
jgi:hypothetical protein